MIEPASTSDASTRQGYPDDLPLAEARRRFFRDNGFGEDGGYTQRFFWLGWKWLPIPVPNTAARIRAVRLHDLHHIAAEFPTTWRGEAEIAAWELGGGCGGYLAAWVLNLSGIVIGLIIAPRATWRAFLCGRRTRNLYHGAFREELLQAPLGELRSLLGLPCRAARSTVADGIHFGGLVVAALALHLLAGALALVALVALASSVRWALGSGSS